MLLYQRQEDIVPQRGDIRLARCLGWVGRVAARVWSGSGGEAGGAEVRFEFVEAGWETEGSRDDEEDRWVWSGHPVYCLFFWFFGFSSFFFLVFRGGNRTLDVPGTTGTRTN